MPHAALTLFCVCAGAAFAQTPTPASFYAAKGYASGGNPYGLAMADFNGDGKPDLAVTDTAANSVTILLGNGDGTFQAPVSYPAGTNPVSLATVDLNADGYLDLAIATDDHGNSGNVTILFGNGNGSFQAPVQYAAGGAPSSVAVGDFNGDGYKDLAVTDVFSGGVNVFLNNGNGTFAPAVNYLAGSIGCWVAVGDFNGDGAPDLAVADGNGSVDVLLNNANGTGSFRAAVNYAAGSFPKFVTVGDFNGDGTPDLAVANFGDGTVSLLLNSGAGGTFQLAVSYAATDCPRCWPWATPMAMAIWT